MPVTPDPSDLPGPDPDAPIRRVTLEVETHVAAGGWDQAPRLYALVQTTDLLASEPELAEQLGVAEGSVEGALTPVEQDDLPDDTTIEELLEQIAWPPQVVGCAVVLERLMLPPEAEAGIPDDADAAADYAASHPDRQEVRIAAAVTRKGEAHCAVRPHVGDGEEVLEGPDLVPGLVELLFQTLAD
ncbi:PPA1309 family protein [Solicola sp. PLA-1-18]|uniref:PPA1309 family protein n=1 Tax=Solicola sp. PLA-1-18 TaxID=3380532 RepID=UPI003B789B4C